VIPSWLRPWLDPALARPAASGRWVVVDVETSGLNVMRDSLISIGALAVNDGAIDLADSFEVVLRQQAPSAGHNIEIHGIGGTEQMEGEDPAAALQAFLRFVGRDPLVAFHASFDSMVLQRALRARLKTAFRRPWLDLADVAPLAWPGRAEGGLDAWLEALGIPMAYRHRAIVDCLATAQLLLAVLREAPRLGAPSARRLLSLSKGDRFLG
jgi:DNA polymerase-3 subunit epsilon